MQLDPSCSGRGERRGGGAPGVGTRPIPRSATWETRWVRSIAPHTSPAPHIHRYRKTGWEVASDSHVELRLTRVCSCSFHSRQTFHGLSVALHDQFLWWIHDAADPPIFYGARQIYFYCIWPPPAHPRTRDQRPSSTPTRLR